MLHKQDGGEQPDRVLCLLQLALSLSFSFVYPSLFLYLVSLCSNCLTATLLLVQNILLLNTNDLTTHITNKFN